MGAIATVTTPRRYATSYQVHATKATTLTMPNNHDGNLEQSTIAIAIPLLTSPNTFFCFGSAAGWQLDEVISFAAKI